MAPLAFLLVFAVFGVGLYVASHAATPDPAVAGTAAVSDATPDASGNRVPNAQTKLCAPRSWKWVDGGLYVLYNDVFNSKDVQCITNNKDESNFKIVKSTTPQYAWSAFPDIFNGCWYNVCSQKGPLPEPLSKLHSLTETLYTKYPHGKQVGDDADDFWFSKGLVGDSHPNGAELMIWSDWHYPSYPGAKLIKINGRRWWLGEYRTTQNGVSWNYIQLRAYHPGPNRLVNLPIVPIIKYCERQGWIKKSWYATSFNAGDEVVKGGVGVETYAYRLTF